MTDKINEVGGLVSELKGVIEAEIAEIGEKFTAYEEEVASLKAAASQGGGTGAVDDSAARLDALGGELREMIARVKGIVADEPQPAEESPSGGSNDSSAPSPAEGGETAGGSDTAATE